MTYDKQDQPIVGTYTIAEVLGPIGSFVTEFERISIYPVLDGTFRCLVSRWFSPGDLNWENIVFKGDGTTIKSRICGNPVTITSLEDGSAIRGQIGQGLGPDGEFGGNQRH